MFWQRSLQSLDDALRCVAETRLLAASTRLPSGFVPESPDGWLQMFVRFQGELSGGVILALSNQLAFDIAACPFGLESADERHVRQVASEFATQVAVVWLSTLCKRPLPQFEPVEVGHVDAPAVYEFAILINEQPVLVFAYVNTPSDKSN